MNRRSFLTALIGTPALVAMITSCGDDTQQGGAYNAPIDADTVVLRISFEGGFVPAGINFVHMPTLLVTGDGRVFTPGVMTLQYPGALLPAIFERSITSQGIEKVLKLAELAELLGTIPDYSLPGDSMIADAPDTVVTLTVNGTTFVHRAYALGIDSPAGGPSTPARDNLQEFVELLADLSGAVGVDNVGGERAFVADNYRLQAMVVDPTQWTDPAPTIVAWPAETGVVLADSTVCATVAAAKVGALFTEATQLTFFQENELVYQLAVIAALPGDAAC